VVSDGRQDEEPRYRKNGDVPWATIGFTILALVNMVAFYGVWYNAEKVEDARVERIGQLNRINAAQCASLQNLYGVIRTSVANSDAAIDELDYYKQHPLERERAHERNRETLEAFRTPPCPRNFVLPKEIE
jgi:hypothetical protein